MECVGSERNPCRFVRGGSSRKYTGTSIWTGPWLAADSIQRWQNEANGSEPGLSPSQTKVASLERAIAGSYSGGLFPVPAVISRITQPNAPPERRKTGRNSTPEGRTKTGENYCTCFASFTSMPALSELQISSSKTVQIRDNAIFSSCRLSEVRQWALGPASPQFASCFRLE